MSGGLVGQLEADLSPPSRSFLEKISDVYGVSADWLLNGHGDMQRPPGGGFSGRKLRIEPPDSSRPGHGDVRIAGKEYSFVRRMGLSVSAGNGLDPLPEKEEDGIILPQAWFKRRGLKPDLCVLVSVRGDSMAPVIPDGALVMIDASVRTFSAPGIYAFSWQGQAYVKRVLPTGKGKDGKPAALVLLSDNPAYPPVTLTGPDMNAPSVAGLVRTVISMMED